MSAAPSPPELSPSLHARRLRALDRPAARATFRLLAEVSGEESPSPSSEHLDALLAEEGFWVYAAIDEYRVLGGLTAHLLPLTHGPGHQLLLRDVAVTPAHRHQGVGRLLVETVLSAARHLGVTEVLLAADARATEALDFCRALGGVESRLRRFSWRTHS